MYKDIKPMLTSSEIIKHLEEKGVKFDISGKECAEKYLKENNNFFKLSSYRKNFHKYENGENEGKYINLDFEMLKDLAIIDMRLRKTLLNIVLDLEHYAKVNILRKLEEQGSNGYDIVTEYIAELKKNEIYSNLENELTKVGKGIYCKDIVDKYKDDCPVWAFIEIIPFGRFTDFYKFVANKYDDKVMIDEAYMLKDVRKLRNACAHNNCIINDLNAIKLKSNTSKHSINYKIIQELSKLNISKKIRDNKLSNPRIKQIVTLLYLNKTINTSTGVLKHQIKELIEIQRRINEKIDYYSANELITTSFNFLNKIIDFWYTNTI